MKYDGVQVKLVKELLRQVRETNTEAERSRYRKARRDYVQQGLQNYFRAQEEESIIRFSSNGQRPPAHDNGSLTLALAADEDAFARYSATEAQTPETPLTVRPSGRSPYFVR